MAAYARAHVMKYSVFTVDDTDFANQITKARFVPDAPTQQLRTLIPDGVITDQDSATWTLELGGIQDFGTGSLGKAIRDAYASGANLEIVFQPKTGVGQDAATAMVKGIPLPFGGDQGQFRTFDVVLPVVGEPTFSQSS